jgi:hypothetical protein
MTTIIDNSTIRRTPLEEESACCRGLYLHKTIIHKRHSCPSRIRTRNPSKWAAADQLLRSCCHRNRSTASVKLQCMVHIMLVPMLNVLYFLISTFWSTYALPKMAVSVVHWLPDVLLCFSVSFRMILKWFRLPILLLISLLFLHLACAVFLLLGLGFYLDHISVSWNCNIY